MIQQSALYRGSVFHRRVSPRQHEFRVPISMLYLDLAELPQVEALFRGTPVSFQRKHYLGDPALPLDEAVRIEVERVLGERPRGPIRLLTHPTYWGYCFNPVSFYYCFDEIDGGVEHVLAEVTNTPWDERFSYAVPFGSGKASLAKAFHVSPFMPMDLDYEWTFSRPGPQLQFAMAVQRRGEQFFEAQLSLERRPLTRGQLLRAMLRFPWMTARVSVGIYWQALRLWSKGVPFHPHPET